MRQELEDALDAIRTAVRDAEDYPDDVKGPPDELVEAVDRIRRALGDAELIMY